MTYKIVNNLCPESLQGKFTLSFQISAYETRSYYDISIPKQYIEFFKRNVHYSAIKLWNEIPLQIRTNPTISAFKRKLKKLAIPAIIPKTTSLGRAASINLYIVKLAYLSYIVTYLYFNLHSMFFNLIEICG